MGYTTDFEGYLETNRPLTIVEKETINDFSDERHEGSKYPGIWCQWIIADDDKLEWDGGEKFYNYVEWLEYLIKNYFNVWDVKLNGTIKWQGESMDDRGKIIVENNNIKVVDLE